MTDSQIILIADDEDQILKIYQSRLEQEGFRVLTARDGREAVDLAKKYKPNLIIMDVKMPVIDGVDAAIQLKENEETRNIKLVFLSAFTDLDQEVDRKVARELGALDYIKKGISLNDLVDQVKGFLKK